MDEVSNFCPAIAVPITVKIPEPMTAPMPRAVREIGPSVFFSRRSGSSESEISLSMDLQQNSWLSEVRMTAAGSVVCDKRLWSPEKRAFSEFAHGVWPIRVPCVFENRNGQTPSALSQLPYRFAWPRASFLTLGFFDPRA